ncbi:MAG: hypothetical protein KC684_04245 [Candidatus Omnitrophica bacterium]|nr:hypothetical protein [Candidatus Omnitrophota bacterium]
MTSKKSALFLIVFLMTLFIISCASSQSRFVYLNDGVKLSPKSTNAEIFVFKDGNVPERPFEKIVRLDVHLEKSHFVGSDLDNAMPLLLKQARQAGVDGIIEIRERFSRVAETKIYHVTAIGIIFTD